MSSTIDKQSAGELVKELGANIKRLRLAKKMSQKELADAIEASYPRISEIENGLGNPTISTISAIAEALGTTADKLLKKKLEKSA